MGRELLDTMSVCGGLVSGGSVYRFLVEYRKTVFSDGMFVGLFGPRGCPSVPGSVVATVMVCYRRRVGLSDREAIGGLRCGIRLEGRGGTVVDR